MSAPSIPNLLSLRASRGGSSRASRGRGPGGGIASAGHDATIQGTDTDAAVSRLSAVDVGYLDDPYAQFFVQATDGPASRRFPIINRGTYTRTTALDTLVDAFLSDIDDSVDGATKPRQIVSLGAGTDTRPFRLFTRSPDRRPRLVYHELDFDVVCRKKLRIVQTTPLLSSILPQASPIPPASTSDGEELPPPSSSWSSSLTEGDEYYCHGIDLRQLSNPSPAPSSDSTAAPTLLPGLRTDLPTLVISECCLCYLPPEDASRCLSYFTSQIPSLATVIYEPTRPDDPFGKIMVSNLAARRIRMPTLEIYREPKDQEVRLRKAGFELVRQMTVEGIWDTWVQPEEKERVDSLEGLDEVEEWKLLAAHYVVAWGSKGGGFTSWDGMGGGA